MLILKIARRLGVPDLVLLKAVRTKIKAPHNGEHAKI
jgi:hypothetical protein